MRQQRLQRLQHLVHVVLVDQPTQNARLLLDHEHGLRHAREEILFLRTRDHAHLNAVLEIGGIEGRHFFDGVQNEEGAKKYVIAPVGLTDNDTIYSGPNADIKPGNTLPISNIPVGTFIYNIELYPGKGAQLVRSAGSAAQLMAKENGMAQVRLPSGEVRIVRLDCHATVGQVSNIDHENVKVGKAGKTRHRGIRPTVRGSVMNPCDHPHGGGEGRAPIGRPGPVTPWGKPALGYKTRNKKARTEKFIVRHRNGK